MSHVVYFFCMLRRLLLISAGIILTLSTFAATPSNKTAEAARLNNIGAAYMNQQLFEKALKSFSEAAALGLVGERHHDDFLVRPATFEDLRMFVGGEFTPNNVNPSLGLDLMPLTTETREQFNVDGKVNGVVVSSVDPNSEAADKGFRPGDVIVGIGNKTVRTPADFEQGVADAKKSGRETVLLLVSGDQGQHYVALKVAKG